MSYIDSCDWSKCNLCGECLVQCPVMKMDYDEAAREMSALLEGKKAKRVFSECTTCFNCNQYCPEGLRPHELILQRFTEKRNGKMPKFVPYLCNGLPDSESKHSMFPDLYSQLTEEENTILNSWRNVPADAKEILWVGCIGRLSCKDLEYSTVLKDLPKFGPPDLCCGELAYRLHSWNAYKKTIEKTLARFEALNIDTMVCYCGSCYNYFTTILKKVYGRELPFKVISLYQWLLNKVEDGSLELKKPLDFTAAVHESCYVTELESGFPQELRQLYSSAGMKVVELDHHGDCNMTCGATTVLRDMNPYKSFLREHKRKYAEVKQTETNEIALNCPGCYITLSFTSKFFGKKLRYMPDELLRAYGDEITKPIGTRIPLFLKAFTKRGPGLLLKVRSNDE